MDAQAAGGFGDIAVAVGEDALHVFPLGAGQGGGGEVGGGGIGGAGFAGAAAEGLDDLVGVGRFGEVVAGAYRGPPGPPPRSTPNGYPAGCWLTEVTLSDRPDANRQPA